jgi:uncharacterized protein YuzE
MAGIDVSYDEHGPRLTVWFDHPKKECSSETRAKDIIVKKDEKGRVIGVEHLHYFDSEREAATDDSPIPAP